MDDINSLRQQLAAAQFLVNSLAAQLQRAEDQYTAAQQFHRHHVPRDITLAGLEIEQAGSAQARRSSEQDRPVPTLSGVLNEDAGQSSTYERISPVTSTQGHADGGDDDGTLEQQLGRDDVNPEEAEPIYYAMPEGMTLPTLEVKHVYPSVSAKEKCVEGVRIATSKLGHTCSGSIHAPPKRHHTSRLRFLREEVPKLMDLTRETSTKDIQEAVFLRFGTRISLAQCSKVKGPIRQRKPAFQGCGNCGEAGHNRQTCKA
ncbi:hypothetical protein LTR65_004030 [Meristemomyces frigidus]